MNIVLLRVRLNQAEINQLIKEFPDYLFLSYPDPVLKPISPDNWARVEILFGNQVTKEEWQWASALKWIHSPSPSLHRLPLADIKSQGTILISDTREENSRQIAEYVIASTLAFTKNLFNWKAADHFPGLLWDAKWRNSMGSLPGQTFLQIGMDKTGIEIAKFAQFFGLEVIGIDKERSFHPYCHKNLSIKDLHSVLPQADIISLHLPRTKETAGWFGIPELKLLKPDSILIVTGSTPLFDHPIDPALLEPLKGVIIDSSYHAPMAPSSPLWQLSNLIITPEVAPRPKSQDREAFKIFRYNLRQYIHDNFIDMKNLIDTKVELEDTINIANI